MLTEEQIVDALEQSGQALRWTKKAEVFELEGTLVVTDDEGPLGSFEIRMLVPTTFPQDAPEVFETGDKLPKTVDRHFFLDGSFCLGIHEFWLLTSAQTDFLAFLNGPVQSFFFSQIYFDASGVWPFEDLSHGASGFVEAFSELFGCKPDAAVVLAVIQQYDGNRFKGHHTCACGSGEIVRKCHFQKYKTLQAHHESRAIRLMAINFMKYLKHELEYQINGGAT